jgi:hypothetical protein
LKALKEYSLLAAQRIRLNLDHACGASALGSAGRTKQGREHIDADDDDGCAGEFRKLHLGIVRRGSFCALLQSDVHSTQVEGELKADLAAAQPQHDTPRIL